ncbi:MAG TPA: TrmB family transcriptional regulator sugar-binding domain-containing protein, partial [Chloroflexota bacterium]|nr:TrmB family transcriptional regulator sugar-binding domain-containing protein [Chloroflexota bacterium]
PSSKTYATLRKLLAKGAVASFAEGETTRYVALPPAQVLERYRESINVTLDHLESGLSQITADEAEEQVLSMRGELSVLANAREVIASAGHEIYISLWKDELPALRKALLDAAARGVRVHVMHYGEAPALSGVALYSHSHAGIVMQRIGGRLLVLVADDTRTVIARFTADNQVYGFSSQNRALALLAKEYLGHDIILECAKDRIERREWDAWWRSRGDLVEIIIGSELLPYTTFPVADGDVTQEAR